MQGEIMARGVITAAHTSKAGTTLPAETNGDATNGHSTPNSGNTKVLVRNSSVDTAYDVTIHVRKSIDGHNVEEMVKEIPFGATMVFGPYDRENYGEDLWINVENAALKIRVLEG